MAKQTDNWQCSCHVTTIITGPWCKTNLTVSVPHCAAVWETSFFFKHLPCFLQLLVLGEDQMNSLNWNTKMYKRKLRSKISIFSFSMSVSSYLRWGVKSVRACLHGILTLPNRSPLKHTILFWVGSIFNWKQSCHVHEVLWVMGPR